MFIVDYIVYMCIDAGVQVKQHLKHLFDYWNHFNRSQITIFLQTLITENNTKYKS